MNDGTEETIQAATGPLPSPIIDSNLVVEKGLNGSGQAQSPQDRFYSVARETAKDQAERTFRSTIDPYSVKLDGQEARRLAQFIYYGNDREQLSQIWRVGEAQENFLREFKDKYRERLFQLSTEYGASTEETRQLLVFARTDKDAGSYTQDRTSVRASVSLFSTTPLRQEDITEDILNAFRKRVDLYQKFFDEFAPTKEDD